MDEKLISNSGGVYVMCHSLQYELGEGKDLVLQCAIPSL